jgi:pimeloyl-ACP methyl ester carboxylesterase
MGTTTIVRRDHELRALSRMAFQELAGAPGGIGAIHRAVADRVFRATGPAAATVERAHRTIASASYAAVRGGFTAAGLLADAALRSRDRDISDGPRGAAVVAAVQGLRGDVLEREGSPLHRPMAIRVRGEAIPPTPDALRRAFPQATSKMVVFVHGLMETEHAWWWRADERGGTYGSRLRDELEITPVFIRYNTGRHISENGRSLDELLDALTTNWPVDVDRLALVGHSMGGLVARAAGHCATQRGDVRWLDPLHHVVSLGTPHLGAPLEQGVAVLSAALDALPETQPFASFLRKRSSGIRDLRQGSLVDEDWRDRDPDALRAAACAEVPLLPGVTHCFVTASVTKSKEHPVARLVGDLLVLEPSGAGRSRRRTLGFRPEDGLHVGPATHFALLNHPDVDAQLRRWLA